MLNYTLLYHTILYNTFLYYTILGCIILYCIIPDLIIVYYAVVYYLLGTGRAAGGRKAAAGERLGEHEIRAAAYGRDFGSWTHERRQKLGGLQYSYQAFTGTPNALIFLVLDILL